MRIATDGNESIEDEGELEKYVIGKKWDWIDNGKDKSCDVDFKAEGVMTGCGALGEWKVLDPKTIWTDF